jgi:hypothetical protein
VKHGLGLRQRLVDRRVDAVAGAFHVAGAALDLAVVDADLHEGRGRHFGPMHPKRDLVVAVAAAGNDEGQVVEDSLAETVHVGEPMRRREIDPRLPFLGAGVPERFRRNPELHGTLLCCLPLDGGLGSVQSLL